MKTSKDELAADALGLLVAHWAKWDGQLIVEAFLAALEDANFHSFRAQVEELWEAEKTPRN